MAIKFARTIASYTNSLNLHSTASLVTDPIIILGNQKSGTSAITALLGQATQEPYIIDILHRIKIPKLREKLASGQVKIHQLIDANKSCFSQKIIKDPNLTFFYKDLRSIFKAPRFVFVIRDPRSNIRSILNRLNLPGDLDFLSPSYTEKWPENLHGWKLILKGQYPPVPGNTYIECLAERWNLAANIYLQNSQNISLVKYEDFLVNKQQVIIDLADRVGLVAHTDVAHLVDKQFQPRGNQDISWLDFFGDKNLQMIEAVCAKTMAGFGYYPST